MKHLALCSTLMMIVLLGQEGWAVDEPALDIVLSGGRVVDGTGSPWYAADVGVRDGRIVRIGRLDDAPATRRLDVSGLVVAPGFIDLMGQTATPLARRPESALNLLTQGITTINAGEGHSAAPLGDEAGRAAGWQTMAEYFAYLEAQGLPLNIVQTVGHTQVRQIVLGDVDRRPSDDELRRMQALVREGMQAGAIGVSTALIYPPAVYGTTEEIAALARVAGEYGGRYYTHMRNEGDRLLAGIDEALEIGEAAGVPVHIFHLKAAGRQNWAAMDQAIARIKAARAAGHEVTADVYPYINNGLGIAALVHPRHFADGPDKLRRRLDDPALRQEIRREMETGTGWENWYRHAGFDWDRIVVAGMTAPPFAAHSGQSVAAIAAALDRDPWDVFFDLVKTGAFAMPQTMSEANVMAALRQEFISVCTDVGPDSGSGIATHPRAYGAFPRVLARYVRELGVLSLEQAVARMSAHAANDLMLRDRGRIAEGLAADLVVFDPQTVQDRATFAEPHRPSVGIRYVLVNGTVVAEDGKYTGAKPGRVLRGPGYRAKLIP